MEENKAHIRAFLAKYIRNHELANNEDIFDVGYVNSLFALQLILFLEKEFAIKIENQDLKLENFRSLDAMDDLIQRKKNL